MSKPTAIRLPDETYGRLQALAERTGRTTADSAEEVLERIHKGEETVSTLEDVERPLTPRAGPSRAGSAR